MPLPRRRLRPPPLPVPELPRPALLARLQAGRAPSRLVDVLTGPPGCGKTTLAARLAADFAGPVAWADLAGLEADVHDLVAATCQALALALPGFSDHAARLLLGEPDPRRVSRHAAGLIAAEIEALAPDGALLVLDGLDAVAALPAAAHWLEQLIDFFPAEGQLVLIGRARPPLRLAPLRLAGSLTELGAADWPVTPAEASAWVAPALAERAAGWIAALAWTARHGELDEAALGAYLRESWLDGLGPERRAALASGPYDEDVLLANGALHPLLARLLDAEADPLARAAALKASAPAEAIVAYLAAGASQPALALLAELGPVLAERGALERLDQLLQAFPPEARAASPWQAARGELLRLRGELDEAEACFRAAGEVAQALLGRAAIAAVRGDGAMRALATAALAVADAHGRARAEGLLGVEALYRGDDAWRVHLGHALASFRAAGDKAGEARTLHNLALGHAHAGEHGAAIALYGEAIAACEAAGRLPFPLTHVNRAILRAQAGEAAPARADAELGLRLARERGVRRDEAYALWALAKLHAGEGRWPVAAGRFEEALAVGREAGDARVQADALAGLAEVALRRGFPDRAWELIEQGTQLRDLAWWDPAVYELALVAAPTLVTLGRTAEARAGLEKLLATLSTSPQRRGQVEAALAPLTAPGPWTGPGPVPPSGKVPPTGAARAHPSTPPLPTIQQAGPSTSPLPPTIAQAGPSATPLPSGEGIPTGQAGPSATPLPSGEDIPTVQAAPSATPLPSGEGISTGQAGPGASPLPKGEGSVPAVQAGPATLRPGQSRPIDEGTPALALTLFGKPDAAVDGQPIPPTRWRGPRIRLLLAYLALERRGATREQLEAAFFGAADASRAAVPLMIKRLREALEPDLAKSTLSRFIRFEDGRYLLDRAEAYECDLERFQAALDLAGRVRDARAIPLLEEALARYRAPLFQGFDDAWTEAPREGARRQAMAALRRLGDQLIASGRAVDALEHAAAFMRLERLAEEPVMVRMGALAALGRREEARRAAVELEKRLRRELDEGPSEELTALSARILRGDYQPLGGFNSP